MRRALLLALAALCTGCLPAAADAGSSLVEAAAPAPAAQEAPPAPAPAPPPRPSHCADYEAMERGQGHPENQHWFNHLDAEGYARVRLACVYNGGGDEWAALDCLWNMEHKGTSHCADGYGWHPWNIPQAKPFAKMGCAGSDHRCQVRWGLGYIDGRYGAPSAALRSWRARSPHWY